MKKIIFAVVAVTWLAASCSFSNNATVGIVKTANGGVDWQGANKIANTEKSLLEKSISQMRWNGAGDKLYASSFNGGLYSTDDAGENWQEVLGNVPIYDFVFDPFDDNIIYAAAYLSDKGRLFATKDGGKSWNEIYSDAGNGNPVRAVAVNPSNTSEVLIGTGKGSLILSNDSGQSWALSRNLSDRVNRIYWTDDALYIIAKRQGVFKSTTGGASYELLTENLRVSRSENKFFSTGGGRASDFRQLAIDPFDSDSLLLTTNKGLFRSDNGGSSWSYASMPFRQQDAEPFAVTFGNGGDNVMYVSTGEVIFKSVDGGNSWTTGDTGTNGLVTTIVVSQNLSQIAFAGVSE